MCFIYERAAAIYVLIIEATASAGRVAVFGERVSDLLVQLVG